MKPPLFALALLMFAAALPVIAKPQELPRTKIEKILGTYANTVGCDFEMDRKNIIEINLNGDGDKVFVALFVNDNGCGGGSGSWTSNLSVLKQYDDHQNKGGLRVIYEMTMPIISGIGLPRFIDRIFIKNGQLWFAGRIHAEKDGNNFPTIPVQARIQLRHSSVQLDAKHKDTIYYWKSAEDFEGK